MNNELEWEKVIQWPQNDTTYLLHITVDSELISIEAEDKFSGELWHSDFTNSVIEDLTSKAKNPKKYPVFVRMLMTALSRSNDSLNAEILTYRQLSNRFGKPGVQKTITPEQAAKRFLILSYVSQFQKMQFPLPLGYQAEPSVDRLKMTVHRMGQQIQLLKEGRDQGALAREVSLLKYENESLKAKLKSNIKMENSVFQQPKMEELQKEITQKNNLIATLKVKIEELNKTCRQSDQKCEEGKEEIQKLQKTLSQKQEQLKKKDKKTRKELEYEQKLEELIKQMTELAEQLQYAKQKEKKSEMKISTLQKQLQKMIAANKQSRYKETEVNRRREYSPEAESGQKEMSIKSGKSGKSGRSNKSGKSLTKGKTTQLSKQIYGANNHGYNSKRISVYDSDTQSSRMRRMNHGKVSPYRQGVAINNSQKKTPRKNERSRSKSKQRVEPQKNPVIVNSQVFTEGDQSEDSSDEHIEKIDSYLKNLKQKKGGAKKVNKPSNQGSKIENRLQTLQQMIKKAAQSTKIKF